MDAIAKKTAKIDGSGEITKARENWLKAANAYDFNKIFNTLVTENYVEYPVNTQLFFEDKEQLLFMAKSNSKGLSPSNEFTVKPLTTICVQDDLSYELGQQLDNINGAKAYYAIIWEKQPEGEWKSRLFSYFGISGH